MAYRNMGAGEAGVELQPENPDWNVPPPAQNNYVADAHQDPDWLRAQAQAHANARAAANYNRPSVAARDRVPRQDFDAITAKIAELDQAEQELLQAPELSPNEIYQIRESYYLQKLELMNQLPKRRRSTMLRRYGPKTIKRMGVSQVNLMGSQQLLHRPYFCYGMFLIDVLMFVWSMQKNDWEFESLEINPMLGPSPQVLIDLGAKVGSKIRNNGEVWRLVTPMFLHAGVIHLVMNMMVLLRLGVSMEEVFGFWRVGIVYVSSSVAGILMSTLFLPEVISVGASAALFGLIGALFGDFIQNHKGMVEGKCAYFFQLCFSSAIGLAIGLFPLIDNFSHVGGWITGLFGGLLFLANTLSDRQGRVISSWYTRPVQALSALVFIAIFLIGFAVLFSSVDAKGWCSFCEKINCVETSYWDCDDSLNPDSGT